MKTLVFLNLLLLLFTCGCSNNYDGDYYVDENVKVLDDNQLTLDNQSYSYARSIYLPNSLQQIRGDFFAYSFNSLKKIYYDGSLSDYCKIKMYGYGSSPLSQASSVKKEFYYKENGEYKLLKDLVIPNDIDYVGDNQFMGARLDSLTIPKHVERIGERSFCEIHLKNKKINFEDESKLEYIGNFAFASTNIKSLDLPTSLKFIGDFALEDNRELNVLSLPFVDLNILDNEYLELLIQSGYSNLSVVNITAGDAITNLISKHHYGHEIEVNIGNSVRVVGNKAGRPAIAVNKITFSPNSNLERLEANAFNYRGLRKIILPGNIKYIGKNALPQGINIYAYGLDIDKISFEDEATKSNLKMHLYNYSKEFKPGYWHFDSNNNPVIWNRIEGLL